VTKLAYCVVLSLIFVSPALAELPLLFDVLRSLDGKIYAGKMTFPNEPDDPMNKPMEISVNVVSENEIRIPLKVGDDGSRTWVLTRTESGVSLKHDHRHPDGSPDKVTNYGGLAVGAPILGVELVFPADEETQAMIPAAATNVWSLRLSPEHNRLYYYLERDSKPRFEAVFELKP
jgi:hypothetical protein